MRLVAVRPSRPDLIVLWPGTDRPLVGGRLVDVESPYWAGHLADGSIVEVAAATPDPDASAVADEASPQHEG